MIEAAAFEDAYEARKAWEGLPAKERQQTRPPKGPMDARLLRYRADLLRTASSDE